jgi:hypothetical protein
MFEWEFFFHIPFASAADIMAYNAKDINSLVYV